MSWNRSRETMFATMDELIEDRILWAWLVEDFSNNSKWIGVGYPNNCPGLRAKVCREVNHPKFGDAMLCIHIFRKKDEWTFRHTHPRPYCSLGLFGELEREEWYCRADGTPYGHSGGLVTPGVVSGIVEPECWHRLRSKPSDAITLALVGKPYPQEDWCMPGLKVVKESKERVLTSAERRAYHRRAIRAYVALRKPQLWPGDINMHHAHEPPSFAM